MSSEIQIVEAEIVETNSMVTALAKSEVESQLDAAHKYPRKMSRFLDDAKSMVSMNPEIAAECFYSLPRRDENGNKIQIQGPSIRMAEIVAGCYGNMHVAARPLDVGPNDKDVTSQATAWDMEKNLRVTVEKRRRITKKNGDRYSDDMIIMTQNAASSIALRDAIFRVVPKVYIMDIYKRARVVAAGDAKSLVQKRAELFEKLIKLGATKERILAKIQRADIESVTMDDVAELIAMGTAVSEKMCTIDEQFPPLEEEKKDAVSALKEDLKKKREPGQEG